MRRPAPTRPITVGLLVGLLALPACRDEAPTDAPAEEAVMPTNRVAIPAAVRRNLGIEFARVERRSVERTLRVPGRFELEPDGRRDHRAPLDGRVEILVAPFQTVEPGTPLYRLSGSGWLDLQERLASTRARLDSMAPVREAHRVHERSLADKVALWKDRLDQLETLRAAGGGNAAATTEARATLNATQAQLAEVMEKEAELAATERVLAAEMTSLLARRRALRGDGCGAAADDDDDALLVCAATRGVVESIDATPGAHVEEGERIVSIIRPERLRVRARLLQSDLGRVTDGLAARIASPAADATTTMPAMPATVRLGPVADGDGRTIDVFAAPASLESWARPGVAVALEIVLDGGREELAIPRRAILDDGGRPIVFRRDPADPNVAIRMEADLGRDDGRWVEILSGVAEGDEVVVEGNYQLVLATGNSTPKGGHFHADGTFHAEDH